MRYRNVLFKKMHHTLSHDHSLHSSDFTFLGGDFEVSVDDAILIVS